MPPGYAHEPPDVGTRSRPALAVGVLKGRWGPVEPATKAKVKAPLEEGCCGWVGPRFELDTPRVNF